MKCEKCGSENMTAQVVATTKMKKGHGCLYTVLFGIFYWTWLVIKWCCKYCIALCYWIIAGWITAIVCAVQKKKFSTPQWYKKMMRRKGKTYTDEKTIFICQDCGNRQNA